MGSQRHPTSKPEQTLTLGAKVKAQKSLTYGMLFSPPSKSWSGGTCQSSGQESTYSSPTQES